MGTPQNIRLPDEMGSRSGQPSDASQQMSDDN